MSNILNLEIQQGEDFLKTLMISSTVNNVTTPIDLTGSTFAAQIREKFTDVSPIASFTFTLQDQETATGKVDMKLANTLLTSLRLERAKKYVYDVEWTDVDSIKKTIMKGSATIAPEVTK